MLVPSPYVTPILPPLNEGPQNAQIHNPKLFSAWEKANGHFSFLLSVYSLQDGSGQRASTRCATSSQVIHTETGELRPKWAGWM